jgi:ribonuclease HII
VSKGRILPPVDVEEELWACGHVVAGVDEAGRGPLYGPVVVGAVVLDAQDLPEAYDSKTLSAERRRELAGRVREKAIAWAVGEASAQEIDELGMTEALRLASQRALEGLNVHPSALIVDGPRDITQSALEVRCVVKGDSKSRSVAAASLLAKTHHDEVVLSLCVDHPGYGIEQNMGYGTPQHLSALTLLGPSDGHRRTFKPVRAAEISVVQLPH